MAYGFEVDGFFLAEWSLVLLCLLVKLMIDQLTFIVDYSFQLVAVGQSRQQNGVLRLVWAERTLIE